MMTDLANYFPKCSGLIAHKSVALLIVLSLAACGDQDQGGSAPKPELATDTATIALSLEDQEVYDISCKVCHEQAASGAPLTGKVADWQARDTQDMASVLTNVVNGYGNMPAMGGCFDCSDDQFTAMIQHMSAGVVK